MKEAAKVLLSSLFIILKIKKIKKRKKNFHHNYSFCNLLQGHLKAILLTKRKEKKKRESPVFEIEGKRLILCQQGQSLQ